MTVDDGCVVVDDGVERERERREREKERERESGKRETTHLETGWSDSRRQGSCFPLLSSVPYHTPSVPLG